MGKFVMNRRHLGLSLAAGLSLPLLSGIALADSSIVVAKPFDWLKNSSFAPSG